MQDYVLSEICDQNALELREVLQVLLGCHGAGVCVHMRVYMYVRMCVSERCFNCEVYLFKNGGSLKGKLEKEMNPSN